MMFYPYTNNGSAGIPLLSLIGVTIKNVFYDVNSIIDFALGGYVSVQNSNFEYFSTCGAVFKNSNPPVINNQQASEKYTQIVENYNNRIITDFSDTSFGDYSLELINCKFSKFNKLKAIASLALWTNPANGVEYRGYAIDLDNFKGQVKVRITL